MAIYWFEDTRQENPRPFGIFNKDVAQTWKNAYATNNGPFKPVEASETKEDETPAEDENNETASVYEDMTKAELADELEAREIEYKSKATNAEMIQLLIEDDESGE